MNIKIIKYYINKILKNSLAKNTLWMFISNGIKLFVQAGYFVVIARVLGVEEYGAFVSILSLAGLIYPFASWGTGEILIKHVSRDRTVFSEYWGNSLFIPCSFGAILIVILLFLINFIIPKDLSLIVVSLLLVSELIFKMIADSAGKAFLAVNMIDKVAQLNLLFSVKNLFAVIIFITFFPTKNLATWSVLYFGSTLGLAVISIALVNYLIEPPKLSLSRFKAEIIQGFYFSVDVAASNINQNIDKTMLPRLSTLEATGIYGAAYRLIDVAFAPVNSLMTAAYAKFFQNGASGIKGNINFAIRLSFIGGFYGLIASLGMFFLAPFVPYILGNEYQAVVEVLRWLSPLLLIVSVQYFAADTLTGAGFQGVRSAIEITAALLNFLLNLWLIPLYSWKGAAWSSLASDGLKLLIFWVVVLTLYQGEIKKKKILKV
jgi:O-antigen/teichoic acid export membrane protein